MDEQKTKYDRFILKIKNNRAIAILIIIGSIIIALSTFTNAAKNLLSLINTETRLDINGEWIADVTYDWKNAIYVEIFTFKGEGDELTGTASFLRLRRGIMEGSVKKDKIEFVTKTQEILEDDDGIRNVIHRYRGEIFSDEIKFVLQTEGGFATHVPFEFTAKRVIKSTFDPVE